MTEMERSKREEKDEDKNENKDMCVDSDNDMAEKLQKLTTSNKQNNKRKLRKWSIVIKEKEEGKESQKEEGKKNGTNGQVV